jgi:hypothetical protein
MAYMVLDGFPKSLSYDWHGRLMFGTDRCRRGGEYVQAFRESCLVDSAYQAFRDFAKMRGSY